MTFPDYHLHSHFSSDSEENIENIINAAINKRMDSICLTDHYDMDFPVMDDEPELDFMLDTVGYKKELEFYREKYAGKLDILTGIELGVMDSTCEKLPAYVKENDYLDFIIASSHIVDGMDPYYPEYFSDKSDKEGYRKYFETILYNVKYFKDYDIYGHIDYILRYGRNQEKSFDIKDYGDLFREIFKTIVYDGKGIEINTGSLYKGMPFPHPNREILKIYKECGGEIITVGSDAHKCEYVGYGFDKAREVLLENGFRYYCTFRSREKTFHNIE